MLGFREIIFPEVLVKVLNRFFIFLLILSAVALAGCFGGDDNDGGYTAPLTGDILVSAVASAGDTNNVPNSFAASIKSGPAAEIRAAAAVNFQARVKIGNNSPRLFDVERSDNGTELQLKETVINAVTPGVQHVLIEIVARDAAADASPILKTIEKVTVTAGQTNDSDAKDSLINFKSTAKALAYEKWPENTSKSIDEMNLTDTDSKALVNAIKSAITAAGEIGKAGNLNTADITGKVQKAVETATTAVPTQNRFDGSYRAFYVNAGAASRWVGVSEISVNNGQITESAKVDPASKLGAIPSYSATENAGALVFSTETKNRGAVSPSGNIAMMHKWNKDPYIGLLIKKPTSATNATLKGTYMVFEYFDSVDSSWKTSRSGTQAYSIKADGAGGMTVQSTFNPDSLNSTFTTGTYSVAGGGRITWNGQSSTTEYSQISPDGSVFAHISFNQGQFCVFAVGIKQGATEWNGSYTEAGINAGTNNSTYQSYSVGSLVAATGSSYTQTEQRSEFATPEALKTFTYTINKGAVTFAGIDKNTYYAGVDASGELSAFASKSADSYNHFSFGVMR